MFTLFAEVLVLCGFAPFSEVLLHGFFIFRFICICIHLIPLLYHLKQEHIGDVSRFTHKSAITAFAGVDPGVNESGTYEQKSVPTSKRGSADLRKTLFQVMDILIKTHPQDDPVYQFLDKKRTQGKPYYVYMTAGANKFLRIYYGRVKEYLSSLPEA